MLHNSLRFTYSWYFALWIIVTCGFLKHNRWISEIYTPLVYAKYMQIYTIAYTTFFAQWQWAHIVSASSDLFWIVVTYKYILWNWVRKKNHIDPKNARALNECYHRIDCLLLNRYEEIKVQVHFPLLFETAQSWWYSYWPVAKKIRLLWRVNAYDTLAEIISDVSQTLEFFKLFIILKSILGWGKAYFNLIQEYYV